MRLKTRIAEQLKGCFDTSPGALFDKAADTRKVIGLQVGGFNSFGHSVQWFNIQYNFNTVRGCGLPAGGGQVGKGAGKNPRPRRAGDGREQGRSRATGRPGPERSGGPAPARSGCRHKGGPSRRARSAAHGAARQGEASDGTRDAGRRSPTDRGASRGGERSGPRRAEAGEREPHEEHRGGWGTGQGRGSGGMAGRTFGFAPAAIRLRPARRRGAGLVAARARPQGREYHRKMSPRAAPRKARGGRFHVKPQPRCTRQRSINSSYSTTGRPDTSITSS